MRTKKLFGKVISVLLSGTMLAGTASAEYPVVSTDDNSDGTFYFAEAAGAVSEAWDGTIASEYAGGDGSESAPYLISNGQQLAFLSQQLDSEGDYTGVFVKLTADIVLNDDVKDNPIVWKSIGLSESEEGRTISFNGTFDGDNHKIIGMYQKSCSQYGLFACIGENGTIKNVGVTDGMIVATAPYTGAIAGKNHGTICNCYNEVEISSVADYDYYGGICGYNGGKIEKCINSGYMYLTGGTSSDSLNYAGGICGYNSEGSISDCTNNAIIRTTSDYVYYVAGICGSNSKGTIRGCHNTKAVIGKDYTGGICGRSDGDISGCSNSGTINGNIMTGGICGDPIKCDITDCNNAGSINGSGNTGGISGYHQAGSIIDCYNTGSVTANGNFEGGICGQFSDSTNTGSILRCYNTGDVHNDYSHITYRNSRGLTGGICGRFTGCLIKQCYNTGKTSSYCSYTGGICGKLEKGKVSECYNSGEVYAGSSSTNYSAGIVAYIEGNGAIEYCYNTAQITGYNKACGLWGWSDDSTTNSMTNCYNIGEVLCSNQATSGYGSAVGYSNGQISNVYYDSNVCTASSAAAWAKTTEQLTTETAISDLGFDAEKWSKNTNSAAYLYYPDLACFDNDKPKYFLGAPVPTGLKAVGGNESVTLTWDAMEDVESYRVYKFADETSALIASNITENSYTVTGLTNGVEVGFTVKSYVNSTLSDECSIVYATPIDVSAPTNVIAVPGIGEVKISWTAAEGATKYAVYYSTDDSEYTLASDTVTDTSHTVTGLTSGQKYYFKVKAYGTGAWSDFSGAVSADIAYFSVSAHSLLLGDDIGVKFYMEFADEVLADPTSTIKFAVNGRENSVLVSEAETSNGHEFICTVAAAEMNDAITVQLYVDDKAKGDSENYSVKTYADYILEHSAEYAEEVPLVNAMLNYGAAAEKYFRGSTELNFTKPDVDASQLSAYKYTVTDNDPTYNFVGQAISLKNKVTAKLYFSGSNFSVGDFKVTQNGVEIDVKRLTLASDNNGTYLAISGIAADKMSVPFMITIGGVTIRNYSVFSYVQGAINSSIDGLPDVVSALYAYGRAAESYSKL